MTANDFLLVTFELSLTGCDRSARKGMDEERFGRFLAASPRKKRDLQVGKKLVKRIRISGTFD